ncbi:type IV pilus modification protein PilV [Psychromonas marina]|uniref:Type IV pilus modification protein PilV n=1 Tax=Psychromonas marina TaxID=88364 RepID=A0ABQ6E5I3_9GAMM|nr:type IV pilus modification protein PilV [Psychromonas marina]GLS92601.1 type IV pilus modification protein PilV [Psychromonas marina]
MPNYINLKKQAGASLIEILVAIFVLAAGLFGLASMQILSFKNINNSQFHTLATMYAYDIGERMRSNREAVSAGYYDNISSSNLVEPNCTPCSPEQVAKLDAFKWNQQISTDVIDGGLPDGTGTVTKVGDVFNITVKWKEQQQSDAGGSVGDAAFTLNIQI